MPAVYGGLTLQLNTEHLTHTISPVFDANSIMLILGSFPSRRSREMSFFYGHPRNRFWRVLSTILNEQIPNTIADKKELLLRHNIALWDVIASCDIRGSSDSTITNVVPNDIGMIIAHSCVKHIYVNGRTAYKLYEKYVLPAIHIKAVCLPSTSPANAAWSEQRLTAAWQIIAEKSK